MFQEPIEKVIDRCRSRIEMSLDCNVGDIIRLIEEIEKNQQKIPNTSHPIWHGMGTGD